MDNLISNSIKYSHNGNIMIDVSYDVKTCTSMIKIIDEGIGMDPSFHTNAFEELVQSDSTMIGAGIGLTICRKIARQMEGDVIIERSKPGEGTTMLFTAKLTLCNQGPEELMTQITKTDLPSLQPIRILLVDDIASNREILKRRLSSISKFGISVKELFECTNGYDAVAKFRLDSGDFQLILMDCHMPILNGFDATVKIHEECSKLGIECVPIVAVTASISSDIHEKCFSVGMNYVVTKPYSELDLVASIKACLAQI